MYLNIYKTSKFKRKLLWHFKFVASHIKGKNFDYIHLLSSIISDYNQKAITVNAIIIQMRYNQK